jgi:hypothetical protein
VLPFFVWLNASIKVVTPCDGLIQDLLDSKTLHFVFVFQNVVQNRFSNAVKIVFVDFVQHAVEKLLNAVLFNGMEVAWDQLNDVRQPVLSDRRDHID